MAQITNKVLAEKIDNIQKTITELKPDIKENNEFRLQAKGFGAAIILMAGLVGAGVTYILNKFWK